MTKKYFIKDLFKTICILIVMSIFVLAVYMAKLNQGDDILLYEKFNQLPIYFKTIFNILIPLFKNYDYLFIYTNIYLLAVIIIYFIHITNKMNLDNAIEMTILTKEKYISEFLLSKLLNILIIILPIYFLYIILSLSIYHSFSLIIIYGLLIHLLILIILSVIIYSLNINDINIKNKIKRKNKCRTN